jgi:hypothetical protein
MTEQNAEDIDSSRVPKVVPALLLVKKITSTSNNKKRNTCVSSC